MNIDAERPPFVLAIRAVTFDTTMERQKQSSHPLILTSSRREKGPSSQPGMLWLRPAAALSY